MLTLVLVKLLYEFLTALDPIWVIPEPTENPTIPPRILPNTSAFFTELGRVSNLPKYLSSFRLRGIENNKYGTTLSDTVPTIFVVTPNIASSLDEALKLSDKAFISSFNLRFFFIEPTKLNPFTS